MITAAEPKILRLTHSMMACFQACPRKCLLRYGCRLRRDRESMPLAWGKAFHAGLDAMKRGETNPADAALAAWDESRIEVEDNLTQRTGLYVMAQMYAWRYGSDAIAYDASEYEFSILFKRMAGVTLAGKIDGTATLPDGRKAIVEHKTCGVDLGSDSDYWQRLRIDSQINMYYLAAQRAGTNAATVLYDVTRKPTIRIKQTETPDDYAKRLSEDVQANPDKYFVRREITRLAGDMDEFVEQLAQVVKMYRLCARWKQWPQNTSSCVGMFGRCEFFDLCTTGAIPEPGGAPDGYRIAEKLHEELLL
ncbi:MAG: PD-(D/E)XK nuclease family protein [Planctomycetes bacterium]|nr:PD-(D/E)XK nuclease family protein [Planctomycetota bacterium]